MQSFRMDCPKCGFNVSIGRKQIKKYRSKKWEKYSFYGGSGRSLISKRYIKFKCPACRETITENAEYNTLRSE